jgi:GNAT superfamily N-acetyltransferase
METEVKSTQAARPGVVVREAVADDADVCGRIFYDAFESIATRHNLPVEPGSPEFTRLATGRMLTGEGFAGVVAERVGDVIGCAFVDERGVVAGIGPVTVDPGAQDDGVGRLLMEALLRRERAREAVAIRLVQTAYHHRSLALYAKLGFVVREPLSVVQGTPPAHRIPGLGVRPAREDDVPECNRLAQRIHGHDRAGELSDAVAAGTARVVEGSRGLSGYATGFGYGWHAVAEANDDLIALLGSAEAFLGLGVLVPSRNAELLRWCLANGLMIVQQSTLMTIGLYNDPAGAWLPSIAY